MARRKNPGGGALLLLGLGVAAVGGVGYAIHRSTQPKKKKVRCGPGQRAQSIAGTQVCVPDDTVEDVEKASVQGVTNRPGKHVGAPSYRDWPFKSRYPTEGAFVAQFEALGYTPGNWLTDAAGRDAVRKFQRDYNTVSGKVAEWMWALTGHKPDAGLGRVTVDGWVGEQTINALVVASQLADKTGMRWRELVELQPHEIDVSDDEDIEVIDDEGPMLGQGSESEEIFFPPPKQGLPPACLSTIRSAFQEYAEVGDAMVMVEFVLDACQSQANVPLRTAILTYIREVALANSLDDVSEYAGSLLF